VRFHFPNSKTSNTNTSHKSKTSNASALNDRKAIVIKTCDDGRVAVSPICKLKRENINLQQIKDDDERIQDEVRKLKQRVRRYHPDYRKVHKDVKLSCAANESQADSVFRHAKSELDGLRDGQKRAAKLRKGSKVMIIGIKSEAFSRFNGRKGRVHSNPNPNSDSGSVEIEFPPVKVSPKNLKLVSKSRNPYPNPKPSPQSYQNPKASHPFESGEKLIISGLSNRPEFNGKTVTLQSTSRNKDLCEVRFKNGDKKRIPVKFLQRPLVTHRGDSHSTNDNNKKVRDKPSVGKQMVLFGLEDDADLNGALVRVEASDDERTIQIIDLDSGEHFQVDSKHLADPSEFEAKESAHSHISDEQLDHQLKTDRKQAQRVDLCFLVDCTSSMQPHIAATKEGIRKIRAEIKSSFPDSELFSSFVAYRDYKDGNNEYLDFTDDSSKFENFVARVRARGGADYCEDVFSGFDSVLNNLSWRNSIRMLYHIADAPCHGKAYHDAKYGDYDSNKDSSKELGRKYMESFYAKNITYVFCRINQSTDMMIDVFSKLSSLEIKTQQLKDPKTLVKVVSSSISTSIENSLRNFEKSVMSSMAGGSNANRLSSLKSSNRSRRTRRTKRRTRTLTSVTEESDPIHMSILS